jgi:hypothetical protein
MTSVAWPVRVAPVGPVSIGAALWRLEGQLMATIVVKITAAFTANGIMRIVEPDPIVVDDEHVDHNPMSGVLVPRELAPQLHRVDVLLAGHACAPPGASQAIVRLSLSQKHGSVLDKSLLVVGDLEDGQPQPFERVRLGWEHAYGGIGNADNPLGTGFGSATTKAPNILLPDGPRDVPVGFGPIPASFPIRKKLLAGTPQKALKRMIADIPAHFDWSYFQCAPPDQRIDALKGDEWLLLDGVDPSGDPIRTRLPGATAVANVYGADEAGVPGSIPLRADMLEIDADRGRCSVVHRGSFPLLHLDAINQFVVAGSYELSDEPVLWPEPDDLEIAPFAPVGSAAAKPSPTFDATAALDPSALAAAAHETLPFAKRAARDRSAAHPPASIQPLPGAPWAKDVPVDPVQLPSGAATVSTVMVSPLAGMSEDEARAALARRRAAKASAKVDAANETSAPKPTAEMTAEREAADRARDEAAREAARKQAEADTEREAAAQREAAARRNAEAERFALEQQAAEAEEARRKVEQEAKKRQAAELLRNDMYGGFKRKR